MTKNPTNCCQSWGSPEMLHYYQSLNASSDRSNVASDLLLKANHIHHETESDEHNRRERSRPQRVLCKGLKLSQQQLPSHASALAAVDKPCTNIEYKEVAVWNAGLRRAVEALETSSKCDIHSDFFSGERPQRHTEASVGLDDPFLNTVNADYKQRLQENQSQSCDLHQLDHRPRVPSRQNTRTTLQQAQNHDADASSNFADVQLDYLDAMANHTKGNLQLGSKWEDAEKWLRPVSHDQKHHPRASQGFVPSFASLKLSDCLHPSSGVENHIDNPMRPASQCTASCILAHTNFVPIGNCIYHSLHPSFANPTPNQQYEYTSANARADVAVNPLLCRASQFPHTDCFHPLANICPPNIKENCGAAELSTPNRNFIKGRSSKQTNAFPPQSQANGTDEPHKGCQMYSYDSSGACISDPKHASDRYLPKLALVTGALSLPHPGPPQPCEANPFGDRFASGECLPSSSTHLYGMTGKQNIMMGFGIQGSVAVPVVSLREVGTQMSSIDCSGSISRYTSKNGSPQKITSPARHNTPAQMRSLAGSASNSGNVRRSTKQFINLEELVECHRAKLELQALSEGERIQSFHRTASNWSSREIEEADLSRSLRHSMPELENESATSLSYKWPAQSYAWNKDDATKLVKLQLKEAQIKAWEKQKKSKADATLKKLEESLAKKRSQTTARVMASLAAAQRKAEEMRASIYAQQRRQGNKAHRFRPRSLSPLRRCTCFSATR